MKPQSVFKVIKALIGRNGGRGENDTFEIAEQSGIQLIGYVNGRGMEKYAFPSVLTPVNI
jgi:hypothetical protein